MIYPSDALPAHHLRRPGERWTHSPQRSIEPKPSACIDAVIPGRAEREPGTWRFRVWFFGPSRNDGKEDSLSRKRLFSVFPKFLLTPR